MKEKSFSIKEAIRFGWRTVLSNFGFFFPFMIILIILNAFFGVITELAEQREMLLLHLTLTIISYVVSIFLSLGIIRITLDFYDGKTPKIEDLFSQGRFLWAAVLAGILFSLIILPGFILFVIPGIYLMCRFYFYDYSIVDKGKNAIDALKDSWKVTEGKVLRIVLFLLALLGINLLGAIAFLVGLFVTVPLSILAFAHVYRNLEDTAHGEKEEETEEEAQKNLEEAEETSEEQAL